MSPRSPGSGPRRTCIGCRRTSAELDGMVRVARAPGGGLVAGRGHPGRGAWLCADPACWARAGRRGAFGRALRAPVPPDAVEVLAAELGF